MFTVYVKTASHCNLNCKHCFTNGNTPPREFFDPAKTVAWINKLHHEQPAEKIKVILFGGEPMLAPLELLQSFVADLRSTVPDIEISITTNLVYKLTDEMLNFFQTLDGFSTSWDPDIRFANDGQEELWRLNKDRVIAAGLDPTLNVTVTKQLVETDQEELLLRLKSFGFNYVLFDRVTNDGNAVLHASLFPSNVQLQQWYLDLHSATQTLDARDWFYNSALEDVYAKFENNNACSGTSCRNCAIEKITINSNGSISGCPNDSLSVTYGTLDSTISEVLFSETRAREYITEKTRHAECFTCDVFSKCSGDCYKLDWQGPVCASPKQLMRKLSGFDLTPLSSSKKIIPIFKDI